MPDIWKMIATILFFGGFSWWAVKWAGKNLRAQIGSSRPGRVSDGLPNAALDAIVSRGLATPMQLMQMSEAERQILGQTALAMLAKAGTDRQRDPVAAVTEGAVPPRAFCPHCATLVENWPARMPWRATCPSCSSALIIRREGPRVILSYDPPG